MNDEVCFVCSADKFARDAKPFMFGFSGTSELSNYLVPHYFVFVVEFMYIVLNIL